MSSNNNITNIIPNEETLLSTITLEKKGIIQLVNLLVSTQSNRTIHNLQQNLQLQDKTTSQYQQYIDYQNKYVMNQWVPLLNTSMNSNNQISNQEFIEHPINQLTEPSTMQSTTIEPSIMNINPMTNQPPNLTINHRSNQIMNQHFLNSTNQPPSNPTNNPLIQ